MLVAGQGHTASCSRHAWDTPATQKSSCATRTSGRTNAKQLDLLPKAANATVPGNGSHDGTITPGTSTHRSRCTKVAVDLSLHGGESRDDLIEGRRLGQVHVSHGFVVPA